MTPSSCRELYALAQPEAPKPPSHVDDRQDAQHCEGVKRENEKIDVSTINSFEEAYNFSERLRKERDKNYETIFNRIYDSLGGDAMVTGPLGAEMASAMARQKENAAKKLKDEAEL